MPSSPKERETFWYFYRPKPKRFTPPFFGEATRNAGAFTNINTYSALVVGEYADATAWQSVAHLTLPVRFGDPVVGLRRRNRLAVGCPPYVADAFSAPVVGLRRRNRSAVGCPPYDHQRINRPNCRRDVRLFCVIFFVLCGGGGFFYFALLGYVSKFYGSQF
ncbi:MAG: hypothetical protein LBQ66_14850 [Planctomycetaceae bacterium]|nr:hypothetical protein [Planctomycetaceae bacterium]